MRSPQNHNSLIPPHGGEGLRPRLVDDDQLSEALKEAEALFSVQISSREQGDLIMLGIGGFTPLTGFMGSEDWRSVCEEMQTSRGVFWPIPITLSVDPSVAQSIAVNQKIALKSRNDEILAIMEVGEKYSIDKKKECDLVFCTQDVKHPGVDQIMRQKEVNLAGPIRVISDGGFRHRYGAMFASPKETRAEFSKRGWRTIAAFQTRNPMHRSHEYLVKIAIEICDGVLIHSLLGQLKPGDIPAPVRCAAIDALVKSYFVDGTVIHAGYPLDMRYAGPREALLHALFRQNYGCTHLIVGRDHAGVGDYYGPFDAHRIFDEVPVDALQIQPLKIDWTFWCYRCESMASMKTCPHDPSDRLLLSGTKLRKYLSEGAQIAAQFSRPEIIQVLREYYASLAESEKVEIELSGHSAR